MAKRKTSTNNELRSLRRGITIDVKRLFEAQDKRIKKYLTAQEVRTFAQMVELEDKFERHVTKLKSDFVDKIDPILKEVTTSREERPIIAKRQTDHEDRIENLEKIHPHESLTSSPIHRKAPQQFPD